MKKSTPTPTPTPSQSPLHLLTTALGPPDASLRDSYLAGTSTPELVNIGRSILSSRILVDASRLYTEAWTFWQHASTAQQKRLRGFSVRLLAVAVHEAVVLSEMDASHAGRTGEDADARAVNERVAQEAWKTGIALRDQAAEALEGAAAHQEKLLAEVDAAKGMAEDASGLARGLSSTASLLRRWLEQHDKALADRLALGNLDADFAAELEAAAKAVTDTTGAAAHRPASGKVTQGDLDREDGVNVLLMGQVIRAFERAHDIDPTIPRLVPISTRRLFNRRSSKKAAPEIPVKPPANTPSKPTSNPVTASPPMPDKIA